MSEPVSYDYFKPLCDKMDGELPTPSNLSELTAIHDEVASAFKMLGRGRQTQLWRPCSRVHLGDTVGLRHGWVDFHFCILPDFRLPNQNPADS